VSSHSADAIVTTRRALAMAEHFDAEDIIVHALDSCGTAMGCLGDESGLDVLAEAIDRAKRAGIHHEVTRASENLAEALLTRHRPADALVHIDTGIAVATEFELHFNRNGLMNSRARALFLLGQWDDAAADARAVLAEPDVSAVNRCQALLQLGSIRARRGDPSAFDALDEALELAGAYAEMQMVVPVVAARSEAAWLAGDRGGAVDAVNVAVPFYAGHPEQWYAGDIALWCHRSGVAWAPDAALPARFALLLRGDARGARDAWAALGCVYEAADALGDSDDVLDLREALHRLTEMGARPRALQVARKLRELGEHDVPKGPRATTRSNQAGLTTREVEVAALLADGLTNSDIAERLVLSGRTVDHHVSSILSKLAVPSRRDVAQAASRRGLDLKKPNRASSR